MVNKHKNSHCFLCYKPAAREFEQNEQNETTSSRNKQKFVSLLFRHLKIQLGFNKIKKQFLCCEDCLLLGDSFCDLFFQLECIQLQLNWKLKRVYDTMFYAGRVPSRVNAFRTQFEKCGHEDGVDVTNLKIFSEIQETRKHLMKNCKLKLKSSKPQVVLKRISSNGHKQAGEEIKIEKLSPKKVNSLIVGSSTVVSSNFSLKLDKCELLAVLMSYVAVLHLSLPTHPSLIPDTFHIHEGSSLPNFDIDTLADMDFIESIRDEEDVKEGEDESIDNEVPHFLHSPEIAFAHDIISEADAEYAEESPKSDPLDGSIEADNKIEQEIETNLYKKDLEMDKSSTFMPDLETVPNEKEQEEMTPMKSLRSLLRCPMCSKTFSNQKNMDFHIKFHDDNVEADDNNKDTKNSDCGPIKLEENTSDSDSDVELEDDDEHIHSDGEMSGSQKANPAKRKPSRYKKVFKPPRNKKLPFTQCEICLVNYSCEAAVEKCRVVNHNLKNYVCCHSCRKLFPCHLFLIYHRTKRPLTNTCLTNNPKDFVPAAAPLFPFQKRIMGHKFCEVEGCYEVFNYEESLKIHAKTHGKWSCTFCPEEFEKAHDFAAHELSKHNNSKKPATEDEIREAGNSNEEALDISRKEAIGTQRLRCSRCTTSYEKRTALMDHFLHKHLDIPKPIEKSGPRCEICKRTFHPEVTQKDMNKHAFTHDVEGLTPEQISKCTICQAPFRHRIQLSNHMRLVHNQKPVYKCRYCEKQYKTFTSFSKHTTQKHKGKPRGLTGIFECPICKDRVDSEYNLKMHLLQHKDDDKLVFKCETCQKSFSKKWHLYKHVKNMHEQPKKTWHCDKCGKVFKTSTKLEQHTSYTHTDPSQWRFACPEEGCLKRCWSRQKLTEHIRTHTKERPFICDFCGESYRYRQYLRTHLAKVHGPSAAKTLPTQSYTKPFDQEVKEKVVAGAEFSEPGSSMDISSDL